MDQGMQINPGTLPMFLNQLDARMTRTNGAARTAAVLPTGQTKPPQPKSSELSQDEKYFADKTMGYIKDPAERYKRYAAQKSVMRTR